MYGASLCLCKQLRRQLPRHRYAHALKNLPQASMIKWLDVAVIVCFVTCFRIGWRGVRAIERTGNDGCPYLLPFGMSLLGHSGH